MTKNEKKFYVIRKWKKTWVFNSWDECKINVTWYSDAKYKSFKNLQEAEAALKNSREPYYENNQSKKAKSNNLNKMNEDEKSKLEDSVPFFTKSIAVDAACSENPWKMEYRWVDLQTWKEIFHEKFSLWTNNIWEFLAIVHGLKYLWENDSSIYSDSKIAISRVNQWKCKTQLKYSNNPDLEKLFDTIHNAEMRLRDNWINHKIFKRNTEDRWEIPADFWRK
jgi:ribonuclease HI